MTKIVLEWFFRIVGLRQSVQVMYHRALILPSDPECCFINVTNLSPQREVEVTDV